MGLTPMQLRWGILMLIFGKSKFILYADTKLTQICVTSVPESHIPLIIRLVYSAEVFKFNIHTLAVDAPH